MANDIIRPDDLPPRANPVASEVVPSDNGSIVAGVTWADGVNAGRPLASQNEAEAGVNATKAMTPLTTKQAIDAQAITGLTAGENVTISGPANNPVIDATAELNSGDKGDVSVITPTSEWRINRQFDTVAALLADDGSSQTGMGYAGSGAPVTVAPGDITTAQGFRYEVAAADASDHHVETASGVKLYVLPVVGKYYVPAFGMPSGADWTAVIAKAIASIPQGATLSFVGVPQDAEIWHPTQRDGWSGAIEGAGVRLKNMFDRDTYPRGTAAAFFSFGGSYEQVGTLGAGVVRGNSEFTLATGSVAEGDVLGFSIHYTASQNMCRVSKVDGSTITVDRPFIFDMNSGANVFKIDPVKVTVGGFDIDFNGTEAEPRYGYGVFILRGVDCRVYDVKGSFFGSKVVEGSGCMDCTFENIDGSFGTDKAGDGGHSYVTRVSVGNDNILRFVRGYSARHTVDFSGSSRNKAINCEDRHGWSAGFLTHSNNCRDNQFVDCDVYFNGTAAYSFGATDIWNRVVGGKVVNAVLSYLLNDGTNTFQDIDYTATGDANPRMFAPTGTGKHVFKNCKFRNFGVNPLIVSSGSGYNVELEFEDCSFEIANSNGLSNTNGQLNNYSMVFTNCTFTGAPDGTLMDVGNNVKVVLNNPLWHFAESAGSNTSFAAIRAGGVIEQNGGKFSRPPGQANGFGYSFAGGALQITGDPVFENVRQLLRYISVGAELRVSGLTLVGTAVNLANINVTSTFGRAPNLGLSTASPPGTWSDGTRMSFANLNAGGAEGVARIGGAWKTFGAVAA